jgi:hypothetical protein
MCAHQASLSPLYPKIRFACTDHGLSSCDLLRLYFGVIGLRRASDPIPMPFQKTSNNQIPAVDQT